MRNLASLLIVTAAISFSAVPLVRAQNQNDPSTSPQDHVQQHQQLRPPSSSKNSESRPDQSAEAPQSPAIITPPTTGDRSVITPPDTGAANMPVIKPPGSPGNKDEIQPK
jgi:hypothetical protein